MKTFISALRYAIHSRYKLPLEIGGGLFTREELTRVADALENPTASFLGYVEARRLSASDPKEAEFWQRLAGSVRKALTL